MIVGLIFAPNEDVKAADEIQCVDGSYLTEDEYDATALYMDWLNADDEEP